MPLEQKMQQSNPFTALLTVQRSEQTVQLWQETREIEHLPICESDVIKVSDKLMELVLPWVGVCI